MKIGKKITNPLRILELADSDNAVYVLHWKRHSPAKWIMNMSFGIVSRWVKQGAIFELKK